MSSDPNSIPQHVAIIMDGNGRWASLKNRPRSFGHRAGTQNIRPVADIFSKFGVQYITLFAFSTENWNRPSKEVSAIMQILKSSIKTEIQKLHENNYRIRHIGSLRNLDSSIQKSISDAVSLTSENSKLTINLAFDYGGRAEIINAFQKIISDGISAEEIDENMVSNYLYTHDCPDPDLIIRTAGEMRLSNFLLWQSIYSEFYSTSVLWPDFGESEIVDALNDFKSRQRRFGNTS